MNLTSRIELLVKQGVCPITFGMSENSKPIIMAEQHVKTATGQSKMVHQCVAENYVDALESLQKSADVCATLQSKLVNLRGSN